MAELATEVGFPPGAINVVPGPGHDGRRATSSSTRASTRSRSPARPRRARRSCEIASDGDQAPHARARRQEPEHRLRRRRPRRRDPELGLVDLLLGRPELRGALADPRRAARVYDDFVAKFCRGGRAPQGRRPARRRDADRLADLARAPRPRARLRRDRARGRRRGRRRRRGARRQGRVLPADGAREGRQRDDGRPGGDLRPGRDDHPVRRREGRGPASRTPCATG